MSAELYDVQRRIVKIVWSGLVTPGQVEEVNDTIRGFLHTLGSHFDVLVDMRNVKAFTPETKEKIVAHQKLLLELGMQRASVAVGSAIARMQLNRVAKASNHQTEYQFETLEEALEFLHTHPLSTSVS